MTGCGGITPESCNTGGAITPLSCCGNDQLDGIIFGPFSAGLDVFVSVVGAGFSGYYQHGGGGTGGDAGFGGSGNTIGDPPGPPFIGGDANLGGPGNDLGDGDGGGGGPHGGTPQSQGGVPIE